MGSRYMNLQPKMGKILISSNYDALKQLQNGWWNVEK